MELNVAFDNVRFKIDIYRGIYIKPNVNHYSQINAPVLHNTSRIHKINKLQAWIGNLNTMQKIRRSTHVNI